MPAQPSRATRVLSGLALVSSDFEKHILTGVYSPAVSGRVGDLSWGDRTQSGGLPLGSHRLVLTFLILCHCLTVMAVKAEGPSSLLCGCLAS